MPSWKLKLYVKEGKIDECNDVQFNFEQVWDTITIK